MMNKGQTKNKRCNQKLTPLNIGLSFKSKAYSTQGKHILQAKNTQKYKDCHHKEVVWMKFDHLDHFPKMVNKFEQERGHKLKMKIVQKKKKNPPANGLNVDEGINLFQNGEERPQNNKNNHPQ